MATLAYPNFDGEDFEPDGKFIMYKSLMIHIRNDPIPEEVKRRRIHYLKSEVFPFWHRLGEAREQESKELMAVYEKYNAPGGILERYSQEYAEIKNRIAASDDTILFKDMDLYNPASFSPRSNHHYPDVGNIVFQFKKGLNRKPQVEVRQSGRADDIEHEKPTIHLVPFAGIDGVPHHHNMNPDDDLSLNALLLKILHRLMNDKDGEPFINLVDETKFENYYRVVDRPRCFKFIEQGLRSDISVGYGATAFFNDMLLLFWNAQNANGARSENATRGANLERLMKALLREKGRVGDKLLAQYDAIASQGLERWEDPELIYFQFPYNRRLPGFQREPDRGVLRQFAREQFQKGQERVRQLRSRLATTVSSQGQVAEESPVDVGESRKRPREDGVDVTEDGLDRESKRQRSLRSATPGPSNSSPVSPQRAAARRLRAPAKYAEAIGGQRRGASEPERLMNTADAAAPSGVPGSSSGAAGSGSNTADLSPAALKRSRASADDDSEADDVEAEDVRGGPAGSKRRRLMRDTPPASLSIASPQAGPSTPRQATPEPGDVEPGSAQSHVTSLAGPPTPQPARFPSHYDLPSSKPLKFSRNNITMSKITKMGKKRPWLFSYKTAEGYGIYAFVKCPGPNCKHHFSSHPLREGRARNHILACNQQIRDDRDMVRQYARQVVKDDDRVSDLTVDWARKSNLSLLPPNLKNNHPENFPLSPADG